MDIHPARCLLHDTDHRAKCRHQDERTLGTDGRCPPGSREKPHGSRAEKPAQPTQPAFPAQHTEQHLRPHRLRCRQGTNRCTGTESVAAPCAVRQPAELRHPEQGDGLYPQLHRTDAHPSLLQRHCGNKDRHPAGQSYGNSSAHLHLSNRECLQAWHLPYRAQLYPHPLQ